MWVWTSVVSKLCSSNLCFLFVGLKELWAKTKFYFEPDFAAVQDSRILILQLLCIWSKNYSWASQWKTNLEKNNELSCLQLEPSESFLLAWFLNHICKLLIEYHHKMRTGMGISNGGVKLAIDHPFTKFHDKLSLIFM